ncbi:MAG: hypothetical protein ACRDL8_21515, partial [Solirubrobacteraceae bacterium]
MSHGDDQALAVFRLRAIRLGATTSAIALAGSWVYATVPRHLAIAAPLATALVIAAGTLTVLVVLMASGRRSGRRAQLPVLYAWTVVSLGSIDAAVATTGGETSPLWSNCLLMVVFAAAAYPRRAHLPLLLLTAAGYAAALAAAGGRITPTTLVVRAAAVVATYVLVAFLARELAGMARRRARATG